MVGHSCRRHSCRTLLWTRHPCGALLRDTLVEHSCMYVLARLLPKVTFPVSKTSVSYETPSKSHALSLHNNVSTRFLYIYICIYRTNPTRHASIQSLLQKPRPMSAPQRSTANGCGRYDNGSRTRVYPQPPTVKREPFATHLGTDSDSGRCASNTSAASSTITISGRSS